MEQTDKNYRAVSPLAVVSPILGLLTVLVVFHWSFAVLGLLGIGCGWLALMRIRDNPFELTGHWIAVAGLALSGLMFFVACGWLLFSTGMDVPAGYQLITYEMLQPDPDVPGERIPPKAFELNEKRVFIKSFMSPGRRQLRLTEFVVCPAIPDCNFCKIDPKPTEMVFVQLEGGLTTRYTTNLIGVGGVFHVDANAPIPYSLKADVIK